MTKWVSTNGATDQMGTEMCISPVDLSTADFDTRYTAASCANLAGTKT